MRCCIWHAFNVPGAAAARAALAGVRCCIWHALLHLATTGVAAGHHAPSTLGSTRMSGRPRACAACAAAPAPFAPSPCVRAMRATRARCMPHRAVHAACQQAVLHAACRGGRQYALLKGCAPCRAEEGDVVHPGLFVPGNAGKYIQVGRARTCLHTPAHACTRLRAYTRLRAPCTPKKAPARTPHAPGLVLVLDV